MGSARQTAGPILLVVLLGFLPSPAGHVSATRRDRRDGIIEGGRSRNPEPEVVLWKAG
jgi:hypothetical protein